MSAVVIDDAVTVSVQTGRSPRRPWRTAARCEFGFPTAIISPGMLEDGTRFPDYAWLTCPQISSAVSAAESLGECGAWTARLAESPDLARRVRATDVCVRELRASESGGADPCEGVGLAGQRDPMNVKCLHARVALALVGVDDPVGRSVLESVGRECNDGRCERLVAKRAR